MCGVVLSIPHIPPAAHVAQGLARRLPWLQRELRASEWRRTVIAAGVGATAGLIAIVLGRTAQRLHELFFGLTRGAHLSSAPSLAWGALLVLPAGGLVLGLMLRRTPSTGARAIVDAVEANALHGGRMSIRDSLVLATQTLVSNGCGASVGLEAAYAQLGGASGSAAARWLGFRRPDVRTFVGAGAGGAIAAAFGAPFTGAFYAFEVIIGSYTAPAFAPVLAASLAGAGVSALAGGLTFLPSMATPGRLTLEQDVMLLALSVVAAILGIGLMRATALVETAARRLHIARPWRPLVGGLLLIPLAMATPQVLAAGHGALTTELLAPAPLMLIAGVLAAKLLASSLSLGFGFRGGLFFASLFLGVLLGRVVAALLLMADPALAPPPVVAALVGMAAFGVAVVGGPMTMAMLVLETTHDVDVAAIALAGAMVSSVIVRENFGYSFSTWRLHLRGETVQSARDVGWLRGMTAERLMRRDMVEVPATTPVGKFRACHALGGIGRVVVQRSDGSCAGLVDPSAIWSADDAATPIGTLLTASGKRALEPADSIDRILRTFEEAGVDELPVLGPDRHAVGVLSENYVQKRYAAELARQQRDLFGES